MVPRLGKLSPPLLLKRPDNMNLLRFVLVAPLLSCAITRTEAQISVLPTVETTPVPTSGDAADDMVVWVHPTNPALSTVIGTDKDAGIAVYDLAGSVLQFLPDGRLNNVDLRRDFLLGGSRVALVTSGERNGNVLATYAVDASTRLLHDVAARTIVTTIDVYGCCMYRSPLTDDTYFFVTSQDGEIQQWRLFDDGTGKVDASLVRAFDVGGQAEGCAADDEARSFFVSEENVGIWRYGAEPTDGTTRVQVDHTGTGGHLTADVEGLSIYYAGGGEGYLLASSQGSSTFVAYERKPPHAFRLAFRIVDNPALGIDGASDTDGIDVMNLDLGGAFPGGVFLAQDGSNTGANQNFKFVPWPAIASQASPPLIVDTDYDPAGGNLASHGRDCATAVAAYRNGSGLNPSVLSNQRPPRLGSVLVWDLDCSGHASGTGYLSAYSKPSAGSFGPFGETLVDSTSHHFFTQSAPHSGNTLHFSSPMPPDRALCGLRISLQGFVTGAPATKLTNAIDLRLGL
jgi:3-phytase